MTLVKLVKVTKSTRNRTVSFFFKGNYSFVPGKEEVIGKREKQSEKI